MLFFRKIVNNPLIFDLSLIVTLAAVLRFINYPKRWILDQDQARDAIIGLFSIREGILPLIGPPSSAGPFNFGAHYYYIIYLFTLLSPFSYLGIWIYFTLLSLVTVVLLYLLGRSLIDRTFGLLAGLIGAVASASLINSSNLLNPLLIEPFTVLALFCSVQIIIKRKILYAVFLGLSLGFAINFHLQALGLLSLLFFTGILNSFKIKQKILVFFLSLSFFLLTFLPSLLFDIKNNGAWINSLYFYISEGQNRFYIPIRWLTEIRDFWPRQWGITISDTWQMGYVFVFLFLVSLIIAVKDKFRISKALLAILLTFFVSVVLLRYYKGPRLPLYMVVFQPFLILLTAWFLWVFIKRFKVIGLLLTFIIFLATSLSDLKIITNPTSKASDYQSLFQAVKEQSDKVTIYEYKNSGIPALMTFYFFYRENKISDQGKKIGICQNSPLGCPEDKIVKEYGNILIYDLDNLSLEEIEKIGFKKLTAQDVYNSLYINYPQVISKN